MKLQLISLVSGMFLLMSGGEAISSPLTAQALLSEFRQVCWDVNGASLGPRTRRAGWSAFEPQLGSYLATQRAWGRAEAAKIAQEIPRGSYTADDKLFSKRFGDQSLYLWVAYGNVRKGRELYEITSCSVSDPAATQPIPLDALTTFGGKPPERFGGELAFAYRWVPGLSAGQVNIVVMFVPKSSEARFAALGVPIKGLAMKQQTIKKITK